LWSINHLDERRNDRFNGLGDRLERLVRSHPLLPCAAGLLLRQPVPQLLLYKLAQLSNMQPLPAEAVKVAAASLKALEGARKALAQHEQQSQQLGPSEAAYHRAMIAHYRLLLERWEPAGG
jgi:hypothetical protein